MFAKKQVKGVAACIAGTASMLFIVYVTVIKFLFSANLPNRWSITQIFCTYQDGCLKRGLLGAALWPFRHWNGADTYSLAVKLSWLSSLGVLLILFASISINILGLLKKSQSPPPVSVYVLGFLLMALAIIASPGIQFFFHMAGYLDAFSISILIAGWILVSWYSRRRYLQKPLLVSVMAIPALVSVGIHEMSAVAFLPIYFALTFLMLKERNLVERKSTRFYCMLSIVLSIIAALSALVCASILQSLWNSAPNITAWSANHQNLSHIFDVRKDYFDSTSFIVSAKGAIAGLKKRSALYSLFLGAMHSVALAAMLTASLVYFDRRSSGLHSFSRNKPYSSEKSQQLSDGKWLFLCCLAPLALAILGWDYYRWGSLLTITFICLMASPQGFNIVVESFRFNIFTSRSAAWRLALIAFFLASLFLPPRLFDGKKAHSAKDFFDATSIDSQMVEFYSAFDCQSTPTKDCIRSLSEQ